MAVLARSPRGETTSGASAGSQEEILVLSAAAGAGHVSAAEALVAELNSRGQSSRHEEGLAIRCNNLATLSWKISSLLDDAPRLDQMRQRVRRLAQPKAASHIVSIVLGGD